MGRRPRLIHLTTTDISLALLLQPQLAAFAEAGYDVIGMSAPGPFVDDLRARRHPPRTRHPLHSTHGAAARRARRCSRCGEPSARLRPDIVHTHNPKPGVLGRLAARSARVPPWSTPCTGCTRYPEDRAAKRRVVYGLERVAARCSDAELVQNVEDIPVLARLGIAGAEGAAARQRHRPRALRRDRRRARRARDVRAELGVDDDNVVVGAVGRLVAEKGYRELFAAARALAASAPNVVLRGRRPGRHRQARRHHRRRARGAESSGNVRLLGERRDVERLYAAMDVFVIASWREGFSRSGMEAAAMGVPVIATDVRGCRQVVETERTGLLIPVRDTAAIVGAVQRLASDAELRSAMGRAGIDLARREFDQQRVIDITLATYDEVLGRKQVRS